MAKSKGSAATKAKGTAEAVGEAISAVSRAAKAVKKNVVKPAAKAVGVGGKKKTSGKKK
jgi:hypothetical protein